MKVLSLFDGISCGMVALERVGMKVDRYVAYEIEENAIKVSKNNYPQIEHCGNVFDADYAKYKNFDLLIGGSPCTFWSISKRDRETTSEGQGYKLFQQYVKALEEVKPKFFLYENNHKIPKEIQDQITKELGVEPILINSAILTAQQRYRLYWTNIPIEKIIPRAVYVEDILEDVTNEKNLIDVTKFNGKVEKYSSKLLRIGTIGKGGQGERVYSIKGKSTNLTANGGGRGAKTGLYRIGETVRKLTPIEAERLQTLPDNYTKGISDTQRYKCIGNGWTVDVIAHILKGMK